VHPYQVRLDCGRLIYCPWDDDKLIISYRKPWWEAVMSRDDLSDEQGVEMLKKLSKGSDANAKDHEGASALHVALEYQWRPGVEAMLSLRADPNLGGRKQARPLNMAICSGFEMDVIKQLLQEKADPCAQDEDPSKDENYTSVSFEERRWHRSALHYAVGRSLDITKLLIQHRADINQLDAQSKQPLHLAIEEGKAGTIDLLLESKADVNTGNMSIGMNSTPLHDAAYRSDNKLVEALLMARANVNHQGKQGMTPLHMALRGKQAVNAKLLVDAKADVNIKVAGKTAAQLASTNGMHEFSRALGHDSVEPTSTKESSIILDAEMRRRLYLD
jgi:ankyrin repeat protein